MRRSVLVLSAAILLSACARDPDHEATEFSVRVLDPGTQPGQELVYAFPDDEWPTLQVVVEVDAEWTAGDRIRQPAPRLRGRFPVDVRTRPRPDGGAVAAVTIGEPVHEVEGGREFAGEIHWSARGRVERFDLSVPEGTPPAARALKEALLERLKRLLVPLPVGRIGVGARWKVIRPGPLVEVTTCRLEKLRQDGLRISFRIAGAAPVGAATDAGKLTGDGVMALTFRSFYVTGEEKLAHTRIHLVDDGHKHQQVERVLKVRTSIAD